MADQSDVLDALVASIAAAVYPNGTSQPAVAGGGARVYPGWPVPQQLDADLGAGITHVSVFPLPGEAVTSRYLNGNERELSTSPAKLFLTVAGQAITLSGSIPTAADPHTLVLIVSGKSYAYAVKTTDTLATAASALAALVAVDVPGTAAAGAVLTLPIAGRIGAARVATTGTYSRTLRTQTFPVQITVWAPSPQDRKDVAAAIDVALAAAPFLSLADQKARLSYRGSTTTDAGQKDRAYRRDLVYLAEYSTTLVSTTTTVAVEAINVTAQGADPAVGTLSINTTNL